MSSLPILPTMLCIQCGYVLDGSPGGTCSECGRAFDPENPKTYLPASSLRYRLRRIRKRLFLGGLVGAGFGGLCFTFEWLSMNGPEWVAYVLLFFVAPHGLFIGRSPEVMQKPFLIGGSIILYAMYAAFFFSRCCRLYKIIGACAILLIHAWAWHEIMDMIFGAIAGMISQ